ncbi:ABC transporter substrate-binding protein [Haloarculaceae archaeon H-GB2-1]|nr:ABC transporter substrate-binding protein [Haloarculaceae archaeon H-GB1-1]MEA5409656.1 ABC transporter substrate-binding protein [Haloarculaceae archaeon H-GB2-1]
MFYDSLTRIAPDLSVEPGVAKEWSANDSADEWTFTLRDDVSFHDGGAVTASDVAATFNTVYSDDVGSPGKGTMGSIESVEVVDETTVQFTLPNSNSDFPKLVCKAYGSIVPEDVVTDADARKALGSEERGSGPFVLESFSAGDHLTGVRNEDYHLTAEDGDPLPYVDKVTIKTLPEPSSRMNALRNGEIDMIWKPDPARWNEFKNLDGATTHRVSGGLFNNIVMDVSVEPWSDKRVRQAVMWAVDREKIIQGAANGLGEVANDQPISPAYADHSGDVAAREQDLEKAEQLLADAGYPDGFDLTEEFGMTCPVPETHSMNRVAILLKEQVQQIGIDFEIETMSYSDWISNEWTKADFYVSSYGMRISGANFLKLLLHSEGGWNNESHYSNADLDTVIDNAIAETDPEKKQEYMTEAQQIIRDEGPYSIPMWQDALGVTNDYVKNFELFPVSFIEYPEYYALSGNAPTK